MRLAESAVSFAFPSKGVVQSIAVKVHFHSGWVLVWASGLLGPHGVPASTYPYLYIKHTWYSISVYKVPSLAEANSLESCRIYLEILGRVETIPAPASVFCSLVILLLFAARTSCSLRKTACNGGWILALVLLSTYAQKQNSPPL